VLHRHDDVAALEATLFDGESAVATAVATALVIPLAAAPSAV
jgi:hypothetical protein